MRVLYVVNAMTKESLVGPGDSCHHRFMRNAFRRIGWEVTQYPQPLDAGKARDAHRLGRKGYRALQFAVPRRAASALRVCYSLWYDERSRVDLRRTIAGTPPSLIFEKYSSFQTGCARAAHASGIPYVVQFHAPAEESPHYHMSRRTAALLEARMATAANLATTVVVVSRYLRDYLIRRGIPNEKILVLPNGVDLEQTARAATGTSIRERLGVPSDTLVVGFVGTMRRWQGCGILPEMFANVREKLPNAVFLLVGPFADDQEKGAFDRELVQCGVQDSFLLTGAVPVGDVPAYIKAMDICVMPDSTDYCSPMKLFEYGACGRAVVMPRRPPILEVIRDGDNGLLFHPASARGLAEKILYLADRPALRDSLGARLEQDVRSQHTYVGNVERILDHVTSSARLEPCVSRLSPVGIPAM